MVIAIAVSSIVALLAVGIGVTVFVCKKKASKTGVFVGECVSLCLSLCVCVSVCGVNGLQ